MATGIPHGTLPGAGGPPEPGGNTAGPPSARPAGGWTPGRVVTVVLGSVLALISLGLLGGGGTALWADQALRHDGYVTTGTATYSTTGYALASERVDLGWGSLLTGLIGEVRLRVTPVAPGRPVFVAVGPADRVAAYLAGAAYTMVTGTGPDDRVSRSGAGRPEMPQTAGVWAAEVSGTGTQTLRWTAQAGGWTAVAMNPDGSPGLTVYADVGVSAPRLFELAVDLIIGGIAAGALAGAMILVPVRLAAGRGDRDDGRARQLPHREATG
jgi:hypothetical protein